MNGFICPFCREEPILAEKGGRSLVFCRICDIYWGDSVSGVSTMSESPIFKKVFYNYKFEYKEPLYTKSDKFWYAFSTVLVLVAALLV